MVEKMNKPVFISKVFHLAIIERSDIKFKCDRKIQPALTCIMAENMKNKRLFISRGSLLPKCGTHVSFK